MIETRYVMICDGCGDAYGLGEAFEYENDLIDDAERYGWHYEDGHHYCADCWADIHPIEQEVDTDALNAKKAWENRPPLFEID